MPCTVSTKTVPICGGALYRARGRYSASKHIIFSCRRASDTRRWPRCTVPASHRVSSRSSAGCGSIPKRLRRMASRSVTERQRLAACCCRRCALRAWMSTRHKSQEGFPTCKSINAACLWHCSIVLRIGLFISCGAANGCASAKQRVDFLAASLQRHCSDASPSAGVVVGAMFSGHAVVECTLVPLSESCGAMKVHAAHRRPRVC